MRTIALKLGETVSTNPRKALFLVSLTLTLLLFAVDPALAADGDGASSAGP